MWIDWRQSEFKLKKKLVTLEIYFDFLAIQLNISFFDLDATQVKLFLL